MTLIEMLAAVTILMLLSAILAQVFLQASEASARGRALAEVYQVARALKAVMARDLEGATTDCFVGAENGLTVTPVGDLPPGPYNIPQYGLPPSVPPPGAVPASGAPRDALMNRMLMGGSDYLAFTSSNAGGADKPVAKIFYCLTAAGDLIRVVHADTVFSDMDYAYEAIANPPRSIVNSGQTFDSTNPIHMLAFDRDHVIAQNVLRLKISYLDCGKGGPLLDQGAKSACGSWVDAWDWNSKGKYLPTAVKVQLQLVDHQWKLGGANAVVGRTFNPVKMGADIMNNTTGAFVSDGIPDSPEAGELFDPNNGEAFTFIIDVPLGMRGAGA
jgi:type II secretory pathway pseudopilin PulG